MAKNTFVMYKDREDMIEAMSDEDVASFMRAVYAYQNRGEVKEMTSGAKILFARARKMMDKDGKTYEEICKERSDAGKLGAEARWNGKIANDSNGQESHGKHENSGQTMPDTDTKTNTNKKEIVSKDTTEQALVKKEITIQIDDLIEKLKTVCDDLAVAYEQKEERNFAKHIITAKAFGAFAEKVGQDRKTFAINVLKASIQIKYRKNCTGPMGIYQNYADVYNKFKSKATNNKVGSLAAI